MLNSWKESLVKLLLYLIHNHALLIVEINKRMPPFLRSPQECTLQVSAQSAIWQKGKCWFVFSFDILRQSDWTNPQLAAFYTPTTDCSLCILPVCLLLFCCASRVYLSRFLHLWSLISSISFSLVIIIKCNIEWWFVPSECRLFNLASCLLKHLKWK